MTSGVVLDTMQDDQIEEDVIDSMGREICGIMGDRYINSNYNVYGNSINKCKRNNNTTSKSNNISNGTYYSRRSIWYIDAKILMQKHQYKNFEFSLY